jgi:succinate dehydrogenase flavin-adding protein (antitoxin of CptAB toxin-antitoxin module)
VFTVANMNTISRIGRAGIRRVHFGSPVARYTPPVLRDLSAEQITKIQETNEQLRNRHVQLEATLDSTEKDFARRKRMIYRSKQRGWLEADILMGSWAVQNVPNLTAQQLDEYETILNEETIDIFNYITGKDELPPRLQNLALMKDLQAYALKSNVFDPERYAEIKKTNNLT